MVFELEDSDYEPISRFRLLWRWTSPSHAEFAPDVLDSIRPIGVVRAAVINEFAVDRVRARYPGGGLNAEFARDLRRLRTRDVDERVVRDWLVSLPITPDEAVIVSWDATTAVTAPFVLVARHWSDFFYPSSDDAEVIPPHLKWMLAWHHEELLSSATRVRHWATQIEREMTMPRPIGLVCASVRECPLSSPALSRYSAPTGGTCCDLVELRQSRGSARFGSVLSALFGDGVQSPLARDAFELVRSAVLETDPRSGYEILDRARDQDIVGSRV